MSRKTKIRIAAACIAVGCIVWMLWPSPREEKLKIYFKGIHWSTSWSQFVITNSSSKVLTYQIDLQQERDGIWGQPDFWHPPSHGEITGHGVQTFDLPVSYFGPWRVAVAYGELPRSSLVGRMRLKFSLYAYNRKWMRLWQRLYPYSYSLQAFGPEMYGRKPAGPQLPDP